MPAESNSITLVIPTYGREKVLLDTIGMLLGLEPIAKELIVVDQTVNHEQETIKQLNSWSREGKIRWLQQPRPSIPMAMNRGLQEAANAIVLFLDDDIIPHTDLLRAHLRNYVDPTIGGVVGQVLQPGEEPKSSGGEAYGDGLYRDLTFPFASVIRRPVANVMAGNLSVRRNMALRAGGFDENFVAVAYRFETEFCRRFIKHGGTVVFDPSASIRHLAESRGGTRSYGNHLTTHRPDHSVGDYYFALVAGTANEGLRYIASRLGKSVCTRFHLKRPWWIPFKLLGELRGLVWAIRLKGQGQKLLMT